MRMTNYVKGRRWEWKVKKRLEKEGFVVYRSAGSKGAADLVAVKNSQAYFIQVKINKKPSARELERLYDEAQKCGAFPVVVIWNTKKRHLDSYNVEWGDDKPCLRQSLEW